MTCERLTTRSAWALIGVLALPMLWPARALWTQADQHHGQASASKAPVADLVKAERDATRRCDDFNGQTQ